MLVVMTSFFNKLAAHVRFSKNLPFILLSALDVLFIYVPLSILMRFFIIQNASSFIFSLYFYQSHLLFLSALEYVEKGQASTVLTDSFIKQKRSKKSKKQKLGFVLRFCSVTKF